MILLKRLVNITFIIIFCLLCMFCYQFFSVNSRHSISLAAVHYVSQYGHLDDVRSVFPECDGERVNTLYFESEPDDLPQWTRLVQLDSHGEWQVIGRHRQPLVTTASQRVSGRSFDHSISADL